MIGIFSTAESSSHYQRFNVSLRIDLIARTGFKFCLFNAVIALMSDIPKVGYNLVFS